MKLNYNVNAMVTKRALLSENGAMAKSLEKLSEGLRKLGKQYSIA